MSNNIKFLDSWVDKKNIKNLLVAGKACTLGRENKRISLSCKDANEKKSMDAALKKIFENSASYDRFGEPTEDAKRAVEKIINPPGIENYYFNGPITEDSLENLYMNRRENECLAGCFYYTKKDIGTKIDLEKSAVRTGTYGKVCFFKALENIVTKSLTIKDPSLKQNGSSTLYEIQNEFSLGYNLNFSTIAKAKALYLKENHEKANIIMEKAKGKPFSRSFGLFTGKNKEEALSMANYISTQVEKTEEYLIQQHVVPHDIHNNNLFIDEDLKITFIDLGLWSSVWKEGSEVEVKKQMNLVVYELCRLIFSGAPKNPLYSTAKDINKELGWEWFESQVEKSAHVRQFIEKLYGEEPLIQNQNQFSNSQFWKIPISNEKDLSNLN